MNVLFYDGVCGLCDRFTRFVIARDRRDVFRVAALQGEYARTTLAVHGRDESRLDTVVVLTGEGRLLEKSAAVLFVLRELGWPWRILALGRWVPSQLRDAVYDFVARHRFAWFGRREACRVPTVAERGKFLDFTDPAETQL